jgi:hypothetical protein
MRENERLESKAKILVGQADREGGVEGCRMRWSWVVVKGKKLVAITNSNSNKASRLQQRKRSLASSSILANSETNGIHQ